MSDASLERVQSDLQTVKHAIGLEPSFGWEDVRTEQWMGVGSVFAVIWALLTRPPIQCVGLLPVLAIAVIWTIVLRYRYRRASGRSAYRRHEYSGALIASALIAVAGAGFSIWARHLHISRAFMIGAWAFLFALGLMYQAVIERRYLHLLSYAIPLAAVGLSIPFLAERWWVPIIAAALTLGSFGGAAIQATQLRALEQLTHRPISPTAQDT
jgi:hypothetical protein